MQNMKKVALLLFSIISILAISGTVSAATLEVGPGHTYSTIQSAINAANSGDKIIVYDNSGAAYTYNENVNINKANLNFSTNGNVTVKASNANGDTFAVNANNPIISGFTITGATGTTAHSNVGSSGIYVANTYTATILNNIITGNYNGIYTKGGTSTITNNVVNANTHDGISTAGTSTITGNTITNNANGVDVRSGTGTVKSNTITNNRDNGVAVESASASNHATATIQGNEISYNSNNGIYFGKGVGKALSNSITNNGASGIRVVGIISGFPTINFNRILNNRVHGIYLISGIGTLNAENNWWGKNTGPTTGSAVGTDTCDEGTLTTLDASPYIKLRATASPGTINNYQTSQITADLTWNSNNVQPTGGYVPNGMGATYSVNSFYGTVDSPASTTNGKATSTFHANAYTPTQVTAPISVTVDGVTVPVNVVINAVVANIGMTITNNATNSNVNPYDIIKYTLTLHNAGPQDAHNVVLTTVLPLGLAWYSSPDGTWNSTTRTITWVIGTIGNTADIIKTFEVQACNVGAGQCLAPVASENHTEYPGSSTITSNPLYINKSPVAVSVTDNTNGGKVNVGDYVTYTITLHNAGPDNAENVWLKVMPLNFGLTYVSSDGGVYDTSSRSIIWNNLGTIAPGADLVKTFTVLVNINGAGKNVPVNVYQQNAATRAYTTGTDSIYVKKSVLSMTLADNTTGGQAHVGDLITYTVTIHNAGPDDAENVSAQILPLSCGFDFVSCSAGGVYNSTAKTIAWDSLGNVSSGGDVVLTYTVRVNSIIAGKTITSTASACQTGYTTRPKATDTVKIVS
jgi:uncharacterized repeat protein (TIGR01451 family)